MCQLKLKLFWLFCGFVFASPSVCYSVENDNEHFSRRLVIHESLDHCIHTTYLIRSGDLIQEEGLEQLEDSLELIKFLCWYWIED